MKQSHYFLHRSSFKMKNHHDVNGNSNETLPQRLFKGNFVVFTVFALLELPPGVTINTFTILKYNSN